jgi:hypothetical protein
MSGSGESGEIHIVFPHFLDDEIHAEDRNSEQSSNGAQNPCKSSYGQTFLF